MSLSIQAGNFLFRNLYFVYKPLYSVFKKRQDKFEIDLLNRYVKPGMQIIDVGANIGFYAGILSRLAGNSGKVHCFEPDVINFKRLQKQVRSLRNVSAHQMAIGPKSETIKIYTSPHLNVDHRTYEPEVYESVHEVRAISLDEYLSGNNYKADFIKMDIQGFEIEAFKGMQKVLAANPRLVMISEFWPYGLKKAGSSAQAYFEALTKQNFKVELLEKDSLKTMTAADAAKIADLGEEHYFNILATR